MADTTAFGVAGPDATGSTGSTGGTGSSLDWGQILAGLLGIGGAGLGLAGGVATAQQGQDAYQRQIQQYQLLQALFQLYNMQQQGYNTQAQQAYLQRVMMANRLQDPNQVAAGAQGFLNPFLTGMEDRTAEAVRRNLGERGVLEGGAVDRAVAGAEMGIEGPAYQQALQNYLATQGLSLQAMGAGPPQPATALGMQPGVPTPPRTNAATAGGAGLSGLGPAVSSLLQGLGLAPNAQQQLLRALGMTPGGTRNPQTGLDINAGGGADPGNTGLDINAGGGIDTGSTDIPDYWQSGVDTGAF